MPDMNEYRALIDSALQKYFPPEGSHCDGLLEGMRYSLLAGGKRIRPMLVLEFCRICGGDIMAALPVACGIEMLHTYSLIHDDMPCMDNDELRRGMPTNHVRFGEGNAALAGDALQAEAFAAVLSAPVPDAARASCALILARAAGCRGMCAGQYMDLNEGIFDPMDESAILEIQRCKTGALLSAACMMGAAAAGAPEEKISAAGRYGEALGAAFQIRDDILDVVSDPQELGKMPGSDEKDGKLTCYSLLGMERCLELIESFTQKALECLEAFDSTDFLAALTRGLARRSS